MNLTNQNQRPYKVWMLGLCLALGLPGASPAAVVKYSFSAAELKAAYNAMNPQNYPLSGVAIYRVFMRPAISTDRAYQGALANSAPANALTGYDITGSDPNDGFVFTAPAVWGDNTDDWAGAMNVGLPGGVATERWARFQDIPPTGSEANAPNPAQIKASFITDHNTAFDLSEFTLPNQHFYNQTDSFPTRVPDSAVFSVGIKTNGNAAFNQRTTWLFTNVVFVGGNKTTAVNSFYMDLVGTPEPGTIVLMGAGLAALPLLARFRRKRQKV